MKFNFFERKDTKQETPEKILPFDIRYALEHRGCILSKQDIETLARNNFENEALYLTFKSFRGNPQKHKELLQKYIDSFLENNKLQGENKDFLKEFILETLKDIDKVAVEGTKLSQLSHQGFELWQEKHNELALELSKNSSDVFIMAHSMFIGLNSFLKYFYEERKKLNILIPEWMETETPGYVINFDDEQKSTVDWLKKPFGEIDSIIVDDTKNTGNILKRSKTFLVENGSSDPEVRVIANSF